MDLNRDIAKEICDSLVGCFEELKKSIESHEIALKAIADELITLKSQQNDIVKGLNGINCDVVMENIVVDE